MVSSTHEEATIRLNAVGGSQEPIPCDGPSGPGHLGADHIGCWGSGPVLAQGGGGIQRTARGGAVELLKVRLAGCVSQVRNEAVR